MGVILLFFFLILGAAGGLLGASLGVSVGVLRRSPLQGCLVGIPLLIAGLVGGFVGGEAGVEGDAGYGFTWYGRDFDAFWTVCGAVIALAIVILGSTIVVHLGRRRPDRIETRRTMSGRN